MSGMRWSWKIATVAGIPVRVHATFFLLLGWFFWTGATQSLDEAVRSVGFILAAFACVILHEFGHALTARRYGVLTRDITLLPIGGVARLDRFPRKPSQEVAIALAGPAVNVVLAAILYSYMRFSPDTYDFSNPALLERSFTARLFVFNVVVTGFNLIPAFPMDGGRVLRALLATRLDYVRATQIAAGIGQGIAVLFAAAGLWGNNPVLILIALFVFLAAGQESSMAQMRTAFDGVPVANAMITDFRTLRADQPLERAVEMLLDGHQQDFPVLGARDGDPPVGILTRRDLLAALARGSRDRPVGEIARKDCGVAHPREYLEDVFRRIEQSRCPALLVVSERGDVVGMLTLENVGELAMVHAALGRSRSPQGTHRA